MNSVNFLTKIFRPLMGSIDYLIYKLIGWIFQGIFNLSGITANYELASTIYKRIYLILGIYMIFKISFSFIKYLINPDMMTDKEQGVGKIISRTIISLVLLIAVPIILFSELIPTSEGDKTLMNAVQDGVLNTLPKIILGVSSDESAKNNAVKNGDNMALMMLRAFYYPSENNCDNDDSASALCDISADQASFTLETFVETTDDLLDGNTFMYNYKWPLTTICGILMVVILLGIAVDIAIRVFKIIVLQMIAPVPIMSYIDPKSSKDGAFSHWLKSFGSTYIDLFAKIGVLYILLILIDNLFKSNGIFGDSFSKIEGFNARNFVRVMLCIGLFKFVKDAPKFIKDALGMKDSGGSMFGGLSTLGAAAGAIGGAAAGAIGGFAGGFAASNAAGGNRGKNLLSAVGGGLAGLGRGGIQGAKGASKGNLIKGMSGAISAQGALNARKIGTVAEGSTWSGRMSARAGEFFRGKTAASHDEERLAKLEEEKSKYDRVASTKGNLYDYIMDKGAKAGASTVVAAKHSKYGSLAMSYDNFNTAYQNAKENGASTFKIRTASGHDVVMDTFSGDTAKFASDLQEASATQWAKDNVDDPRLKEYEADAGVVNGIYNAVELKDAKKVAEANSRRIAADTFNLKTSKEYKANKANATAIKKNGK